MPKPRSSLVESVGAVAVVASLLFLAYEIRQANKIARSTISFELSSSYASIDQSVWTDPNVAALRVKTRDPAFMPTPVEREMLLGEIRRLLNVWGAVETAFRNGYQTRQQFDVMLEGLEAILNEYPATRPLWAQELDRYGALESYEFYSRARALVER